MKVIILALSNFTCSTNQCYVVSLLRVLRQSHPVMTVLVSRDELHLAEENSFNLLYSVKNIQAICVATMAWQHQ